MWSKHVFAWAGWFEADLEVPLPDLAPVLQGQLNHQGELQTLSVLRSSGCQACDEVALEAVRRSAPFPPVPKKLQQDGGVTLVSPFVVAYGEKRLATAHVPLAWAEWSSFEKRLAKAVQGLSNRKFVVAGPRTMAVAIQLKEGRVASVSVEEESGDDELDARVLREVTKLVSALEPPDAVPGRTYVVPVRIAP
ncbi:energy transducer TonB [Methylibium rhizosphaerae]|uniref:energy transducer TonB n=1 Tax=Methylibium rhizosphaerae TaxID=2570323 RepID=UPI001126E9E3|nr:energy transducer TonB [Methylibium rhizosphaerae]